MSETVRSEERTIALPSAAVPVGYTLRWPTKEPGGTADYSLDMNAWLTDAVDEIATVTAAVSPYSDEATDLALGNVTHADGVVTLWLTGGVAQRDESVTVTVTTTGARTLELTVWMLVQPLSMNTRVRPAVAVGSRGERGLGVLTGQGAPASILGRNGESYIDDVTGEVWKRGADGWVNTGRTIASAAVTQGAEAGAAAAQGVAAQAATAAVAALGPAGVAAMLGLPIYDYTDPRNSALLTL